MTAKFITREYYHALLDQAMNVTRESESFLEILVNLVLQDAKDRKERLFRDNTNG